MYHKNGEAEREFLNADRRIWGKREENCRIFANNKHSSEKIKVSKYSYNMNSDIQSVNSSFVLYQDDNGITNINVRFDNNDVWLFQQQIASLFDTTQQNVSQHISAIVEEGELPREATHKNFLLVRQEGSRSVKRQKEMLQYESDFDRATKELAARNKDNLKK
jgi:hypothetical protein